MPKPYKCEIQNCKNHTDVRLCEDCRLSIAANYSFTICDRCGTVWRLGGIENVDILYSTDCYVCQGKTVYKYPWEKVKGIDLE